MFGPGVAHPLGDLGPFQSMLINQLEKTNIFLDSPIFLVDMRIEMIVPLLTTVIKITKKITL